MPQCHTVLLSVPQVYISRIVWNRITEPDDDDVDGDDGYDNYFREYRSVLHFFGESSMKVGTDSKSSRA